MRLASPRTRSSSRIASPAQSRRLFGNVIREIASLSDGAVFSSKKDHFVPIGGLLTLNDDALAQRARELVVVYEGFPHYGGLAGYAMEALAQGIRESTDEAVVRHYVGQSAFLGSMLQSAGVPIVLPVGAHGVFVDAKRFLPHLSQEEFPAQALAAALYLAGGVRSMERGIVSGQHGDEPYDGLELVRLTIPRRVYTEEHLRYVADVVIDVHRRRDARAGTADDVRARRAPLLPSTVRAAQAVPRTAASAVRADSTMTIVWFIVWLISDNIGDNEPLTFDPVNVWAATLILAFALDVNRPTVVPGRKTRAGKKEAP